MKMKIALPLILGLSAWVTVGLAQIAEPNAPAQSEPEVADQSEPEAPVQAAPGSELTPPGGTPPPGGIGATNLVPAEGSLFSLPEPAERIPGFEGDDEVLPLVVFDEALLTDAIRTLARQAGVNFLFHPLVLEGLPGPDGTVQEPRPISIRFEDVTAKQALKALLKNHGLQLLADEETGIAQVTIKDPAAPPPLVTAIIQLKYSNATNIVKAVTSLMTDTRSKVIADLRTSKLVVLATESEQKSVTELVDNLDKPDRQVYIESHVVETSTNPQSIKGVNWQDTLEEQHVSFGNGRTEAQTTTTSPGGTTVVTLPSPDISHPESEVVVLKFLAAF